MAATDPIPADPATLIDSLDPEAIAARLDELDRQSRALRVLLRAARARQRAGHAGRRPPEDTDRVD